MNININFSENNNCDSILFLLSKKLTENKNYRLSLNFLDYIKIKSEQSEELQGLNLYFLQEYEEAKEIFEKLYNATKKGIYLNRLINVFIKLNKLCDINTYIDEIDTNLILRHNNIKNYFAICVANNRYDKILEIPHRELYKENLNKIFRYIINEYSEAQFRINKKRAQLNDYFRFNYRCNKCETLSILFNPIADKFSFFKSEFKTDVLFITQKKIFAHYFILNADKLAAIILNMVTKRKYKHIYFFGSSKAGFGALLYYSLTKKLINKNKINCTISALVFSPQIDITNNNLNLHCLPSYIDILNLVKKFSFIRHELILYGDLTKIISNEYDKNITICFGENNVRDKAEVMKIYNRCHIIPINGLSNHGVVKLINFTSKEISKVYIELNKEIIDSDEAYLSHEKQLLSYDDFLILYNQYIYIKSYLPIFKEKS